MTAPGVVDARVMISAPFCAAAVEMVGAEVMFAPPPLPFPPLPPPHPRSAALDKKIAASIATFSRIVRPGERFRRFLFNGRRTPASNRNALCGLIERLLATSLLAPWGLALRRREKLRLYCRSISSNVFFRSIPQR